MLFFILGYGYLDGQLGYKLGYKKVCSAAGASRCQFPKRAHRMP
jgi:hypothetical protein